MSDEQVGEKDIILDEAMLLISGKDADKQYVKKVANATLSCFAKHNIAKLRCVGAASVNNGLKGITIAKMEALEKEIHLFFDVSFTTVDFKGESKTGLLLEVMTVDGFDKNGNLDYDNAVLKVRGDFIDKEDGKRYVKKLASAIISCFSKQNTALLRCIGPASCNNALKAFAIAKEEAKKNNIRFLLDPDFTNIQFDKEEKTGMILEVIGIKGD